MSSGDLFWDNTAALFAGQDFSDQKGHTVVVTSSVSLDGTHTVFGLGTLLFGGVSNDASGTQGSTMRIASAPEFNIGSGDWTVEGWASYQQFSPAYQGINRTIPHAIIERSNATYDSGCWLLSISSHLDGVGTETQSLDFWLSGVGSPLLTFYPNAPTINNWNPATKTFAGAGFFHFAVVRNGDQWTLYINGQVAQTAIAASVLADPTADLRLGNSIFNTDTAGITASNYHGRAFNGNLAWWRLTKGLARYTVDFSTAFTGGGSGPGLPLPTSPRVTDYTGAAGKPGPRGFDGMDGGSGSGGASSSGASSARKTVVLPTPPAKYDAANEAQTRRLIEQAMRRG